jgi:hypothetical protein
VTAPPALIVPLVALCGLAGCGYRAGGPYRSDVRTVYVDMAGSKEFRRDLEFTLTEALKKRIALDTPYRVAAREKADTILTTEVLEERQSAFAPDFRSRQPREKTLTLGVRAQLNDVRTGRLLVKPVLLHAKDYLVQAGETEKLAQEQVCDLLARDIVAALLYEDWGERAPAASRPTESDNTDAR